MIIEDLKKALAGKVNDFMQAYTSHATASYQVRCEKHIAKYQAALVDASGTDVHAIAKCVADWCKITHAKFIEKYNYSVMQRRAKEVEYKNTRAFEDALYRSLSTEKVNFAETLLNRGIRPHSKEKRR